jgi:hypothetical protein
MKINGTITAISEVQEGESTKGAWAKRTVVVKDDSQPYANEFVFSLFKSGEHIDYAKDKFNHKVGDSVEVEYNSRANEYKGKWYGDNRIWKIQSNGASNPIPEAIASDEGDDLPF